MLDYLREKKNCLIIITAAIIIFFHSEVSRSEISSIPTSPAGIGSSEGTSASSKTIPFQLTYDKIVLSGIIGDSTPLKLLLDTGMQSDGILIYNPDIRDSIKLIDPFTAAISGAGKDGPAGAIFSDSMNFRIAGIEFARHRVMMLQSDSFRGFPSDGVIGYSLLGHYAVEIDYDRSEIVLHDSISLNLDDTWTSIPLMFKENNIPWINIQIVIENSVPFDMACYIDSASRETVECLMRPEQKFKLPTKTEPVYLGRGLSGDIMGSRGMISKVRIGSFELADLSAAFVPADHRSKQAGADGVVGGGLLMHFNLVYDYAHLKLHIKSRRSLPAESSPSNGPASPVSLN